MIDRKLSAGRSRQLPTGSPLFLCHTCDNTRAYQCQSQNSPRHVFSSSNLELITVCLISPSPLHTQNPVRMPQNRFVVVLQYPPVYATDPRRCWFEKMNRNEYEFNTQASTSQSGSVWVWVSSHEIAPKPQCTNTFANQWGFIRRLHKHRQPLVLFWIPMRS